MALLSRKIRVTFKLGQGSFGDSGSDTLVLGSTDSNVRVSCVVVKAGGLAKCSLNMQIYGMTLSQVNTLTTLGMVPTLQRRNTITVEAGDDTNGLGVVFIGTINNAWGDFRRMPEVPFVVEAFSGGLEALIPAKPTSIRGPADVAVIMQSLATQAGFTFENNGVTGKLPTTYLAGSVFDQIIACAKAAGIKHIIDVNKLAIWPAGKARGEQIVIVSKDTGLITSPSYVSNGIHFDMIFDRNVSFGCTIKMQSDLKPACGNWVVYSLFHELDANVPQGKWKSQVDASPPGYTVVA